MSTPDPFTAAHQAIFTALQNYAPLTALVAPGNFINITAAQFEQFKPQIASADAPQLRIIQGDFTLPPFGGNSRAVEFSQSYVIQVTIDTLQIVPLNQIKYQIMVALIQAGTQLGLSFVSGYTLSDSRDSFAQPADLIQKSRRWCAVMTVTVQMFLPRQSLADS
ncbi:MAG TPA: hypothetical protein VMD30_14535 [Tepidisphaeraceae bacterium]|nr:hypothetical protein [Tepidisphaeraceae bacterium]